MNMNQTQPERKAIRTYRGIVSRKSGDKTLRVQLDHLMQHPKYGKILKRRTIAHVHDDANAAGPGDLVDIVKCRKLSKTKTWRLLRVVEAGKVM